ncbi:hypothetical protein BaRGS_00008317 [Batillaria attramentaria]|uniref:Elevenin n=1 Tax=Batillaria attramentaria TaxID=370345 RepID=A0ABD0LLT5_9CAEN
MTCHMSISRGLLLVFLSLLVASSLVTSRRIDCTRFVFAPRCRGVAAKRGDNSFTADSTEIDDSYPEPLMTPEVSREENAEKILKILLDLSQSAYPQTQVPQSPVKK